MSVGQTGAADAMTAPGDDGNGTGVPQNNVIQNVTNLANAVAADVAGVYRAVNAPAGTPVQTAGINVGTQGGVFSIGLIPLLLLGGLLWVIFK